MALTVRFFNPAVLSNIFGVRFPFHIIFLKFFYLWLHFLGLNCVCLLQGVGQGWLNSVQYTGKLQDKQ